MPWPQWVTKAIRGLAAGSVPGAMPVRGSSGTGWWPIIREPYTGAWQKNDPLVADTALSYWAVYACITLIAHDIGKLSLDLVEENDDGIWVETSSTAFSPVLRKPNRYQTIHHFIEQWIMSKLTWGNTYVLKERDGRGVVVALYILDPRSVLVLVAPDGSVYYQLSRDYLTGMTGPGYDVTGGRLTVPASELIHDICVPLYHPLVGVTPIYACGTAAAQGLAMQHNSSTFFANLSRPSGILTAPGAISDQTAARLKADWETNYGGGNLGRVAVAADGLKYDPVAINPADAQLIEQLQWTAAPICACFHVPEFMISSSKMPTHANTSEALLQLYYSQCLQTHIVNLEQAWDEGLELPDPYGVQFDIDDLIWMDTATKTTAAKDAIGAGALSPDEVRLKYFGLGPVPGGDTPYLQQQYFSLAALAERDAADPFAKPAPPPPAAPSDQAPPDEPPADLMAYHGALLTKCLAEFRYDA